MASIKSYFMVGVKGLITSLATAFLVKVPLTAAGIGFGNYAEQPIAAIIALLTALTLWGYIWSKFIK